jgi:hypothetical protein
VGLPSLEKEVLFSEAYARETHEVPAGPVKKPIDAMTLIILGLPVFFLLAMYFFYRLSLNNLGEDILSRMT